MGSRALLFLAIFTFLGSFLVAQEPTLRSRPAGPPLLPLLAPAASRGEILGSQRRRVVATDATNPDQQTVLLPLSAGITLISIPLRTDSQVLSDMLQNLPAGSRVWTWDANQKQFVEGFDQELPLGQGAVLYVPSPTVIAITGSTNISSEIPLDLQNGWNLVGVPYDTPLPRSAQNVYVASIRTPFNDAVNNGDLGSSVYSLDVRGQQPVGESDSFQPMNAYWVYSQGADLLALKPPPALRGGSLDFAIWVAKSIDFAGTGQLFKLINGKPNQALFDQLSAITKQIEDIQDTQDKMIEQQKEAAEAIRLDISKINTTVEQQALDKVDVDLRTNLRNPTFKDSLEWFIQNQTLSLSQLNAADADDRTQFSYRVIRQYGLLNDFNVVSNRVQGLNGSSILDNFMREIIISNASGYTLLDRYKAMESYFTTMIGLQIECATLITNAYEQLASSPQYGKEFAGSSADFTNNIYKPALRNEAAKFMSLVNVILARELVLPTNPNQPPIAVSRVIQDEILPRADFMVMNLLGQPAGLRARVLMSPNADGLSIVSSRKGGVTVPLPATAPAFFGFACATALDQNCWTRIAGLTTYDSWASAGAQQPDLIKEFFFTKDWLLLQTMVAVQPGVRDRLGVQDRFGATDWSPGPCRLTGSSCLPSTYGNQELNLQKMAMNRDGNLVASDSGVLFGSVLLARRTTAWGMLHTPGVIYECGPGYIQNSNSDYARAVNCNRPVQVEGSVRLRYCSTCSAPATGNFTWGVTLLRVDGNQGQSYGYSTLFCPSIGQPIGPVAKTQGQLSTFGAFPVKWQPGEVCTFTLGVWASGQPFLVSATRGPVLMSVP